MSGETIIIFLTTEVILESISIHNSSFGSDDLELIMLQKPNLVSKLSAFLEKSYLFLFIGMLANKE